MNTTTNTVHLSFEANEALQEMRDSNKTTFLKSEFTTASKSNFSANNISSRLWELETIGLITPSEEAGTEIECRLTPLGHKADIVITPPKP